MTEIIIFSNIFILVDILMNKDPDKISKVLSFLTKMLEKYEKKDEKDGNEKIKEKFGEMFGRGNYKNIFYLVECPELDGKSLLWYINSQNVRLFRQREELIDLSVKIASLNNEGEKAMDEVINNYKSGLASGVGLRDMINMIKERYPWSSSKMYIMILVSLVACLLGIILYVLDLKTDIEFSLEMFHATATESLQEYPTYASIFENRSQPGPQECWQGFETCWDQHYVDPEKNFTASELNDMKTTGWFAVWHCIQPFVGTFIVFLSMNYRKISSIEIPEGPDCLKKYRHCCVPFQMLWKLGYLLCLLFSVVPIPALTNIYMLYLKVRSHIARSKTQFRKEIEKIERNIKEYGDLGKNWNSRFIYFMPIFSNFFLI